MSPRVADEPEHARLLDHRPAAPICERGRPRYAGHGPAPVVPRRAARRARLEVGLGRRAAARVCAGGAGGRDRARRARWRHDEAARGGSAGVHRGGAARVRGAHRCGAGADAHGQRRGRRRLRADAQGRRYRYVALVLPFVEGTDVAD